MQDEQTQELEGKWLIHDLARLEQRLIDEGACSLHPRVLETNLRFDDAQHNLGKTFRVLRLRMDDQARLTFKGPAQLHHGISQRTEIEFIVSDFQAAKAFLEGLGYSVSFIYEKYRHEYTFSDCTVMLDELPYGDFVEIEGSTAESIQSAADRLGLDLSASSSFSYSMLFEQYNAHCMVAPAEDLTFTAFQGRSVVPEQLGLRYADGE